MSAKQPPEPSSDVADSGDCSDVEITVLYSNDSPTPLGIEEPKRGKILLPLFLTTITVLFTAGLGTALLVWLVRHHAVQGQTVLETLKNQRAFIVDEGTRDSGTEARLTGLTISSIASSLIGITIPFMMTLYAYRIASIWIATSRQTTSLTRTLPTPLQYGLLVRLLGSSSFLSLFDASAYLLRRRRPVVPLILSNAFVVCILVFTLAHLATLSDIWVHSSTHAILGANFTSQIEPQSMTVLFNDTLCDDISPITPCFQGTDSWGDGWPNVRSGGFLIAANSSNTLKLVTLSEHADTALIVPATIDTSTRFTATSFASRTECTSLNSQCLTMKVDGSPVVESCANIGRPELPYWGSVNTALNVIHPVINGTVLTDDNSLELTQGYNPFDLVVQLRWPTFAEDASVLSPNAAVDSDTSNSTESLYATCTFTYFNVTYSYSDGSFAIVDETIMNPNASNIFWGPLLNQLANPRLASDLQATAQAETNGDNVIALLRQDLSRQGLGMIAGAFITSSVLVQQQQITSKTLGRYDAVPVLVLVAILCLYALFALYIFALTVVARAPALRTRLIGGGGKTSIVPQLNLAHARLTSPLPLAADLFRPSLPSLAAQLSVAKSPMEMFIESAETPRLEIGLGEGKFPAYGLRKRSEGEDRDKEA